MPATLRGEPKTVKSRKPNANDRTLLGVAPAPPSSAAKPVGRNAKDRTLLGVARVSRPVPASVTNVAALEPGALVANGYVLGEPVTEGGMATIWAATERATGRSVIVKTIHLHLSDNEEVIKRFEQEADIIAAVRSPHVVELLDRGVLAGSPFLVLERLEGEDLEERLAGTRLSVDECATLLDQVALALMPAHAAGVVHRDLKPGNIYFARVGDGEVVKLLDFGIAKLRESTLALTAAGQTVGTPEYMSPEQLQGSSDLDGRSDLFAMAAVLYTCLTGDAPFLGETIAHTFERITTGDFVPPSRAARNVPQRIDAFFTRALACDRDARYPDAAAMAAAFRAFAADDAPELEVRAESVVPAQPVRSPAPITPPVAVATEPLPTPHDVASAMKLNAVPRSEARSRPPWLLIGAVVFGVAGTVVALTLWSSDETTPRDERSGAPRSRTEQIPVPQQPVVPSATNAPRSRGR